MIVANGERGGGGGAPSRHGNSGRSLRWRTRVTHACTQVISVASVSAGAGGITGERVQERERSSPCTFETVRRWTRVLQ